MQSMIPGCTHRIKPLRSEREQESLAVRGCGDETYEPWTCCVRRSIFWIWGGFSADLSEGVSMIPIRGLSKIRVYLGDLSCILERFRVKEREGPASCAFICDGKFELDHLLSRRLPIWNKASQKARRRTPKRNTRWTNRSEKSERENRLRIA